MKLFIFVTIFTAISAQRLQPPAPPTELITAAAPKAFADVVSSINVNDGSHPSDGSKAEAAETTSAKDKGSSALRLYPSEGSKSYKADANQEDVRLTTNLHGMVTFEFYDEEDSAYPTPATKLRVKSLESIDQIDPNADEINTAYPIPAPRSCADWYYHNCRTPDSSTLESRLTTKTKLHGKSLESIDFIEEDTAYPTPTPAETCSDSYYRNCDNPDSSSWDRTLESGLTAKTKLRGKSSESIDQIDPNDDEINTAYPIAAPAETYFPTDYYTPECWNWYYFNFCKTPDSSSWDPTSQLNIRDDGESMNDPVEIWSGF